MIGLTPGLVGGANAEYTVLSAWARKPDALSWEQAGGAAANVETATRVLDRLEVGSGTSLLIEGGAGGVGTVAVQLAVARGAAVIATAGRHNHEFLAELGATPTTYGEGLGDRVAALGSGRIDAVLDCVGSGSLPDLVRIAGSPDRVVTLADMNAATCGVHLTLAGVFPLENAAAAHRLSETGQRRRDTRGDLGSGGAVARRRRARLPTGHPAALRRRLPRLRLVVSKIEDRNDLRPVVE